jgi:hypothetical protein
MSLSDVKFIVSKNGLWYYKLNTMIRYNRCCIKCMNEGTGKQACYKDENNIKCLCSGHAVENGSFAPQPHDEIKRIVSKSRETDLKKWSRNDIDSFGEYITVDRIEDMLVMQQGECFYECDSGPLILNADNRLSELNAISIERVLNTRPHTIENCVLSHINCNLIRNNSFTFDQMIRYAKHLRAKTHSYCRKCDKLLSANEFSHNKSTRDGLNGYCKSHHNERNRSSKLKRKLNETN